MTRQGNRAVTAKPTSNGLESAWPADDGLKVLVYGRSGTGKTTFWSTFPGQIAVAVCSGGNNPGELGSVGPKDRLKISPFKIKTVDDFRLFIKEHGGAATKVLDHASGLQDLTLKEILGLDELPAQKSWGLVTQQQYGQSSLQCKELFRAFLSLPGHVVIVAQERTFGEEGQSDIIQPTVGAALTPSVTGWLAPACDYVVQTYIRPKMQELSQTVNGKQVVTKRRGKGVEYCLRTEPHDVFQTKFRMPKDRLLPECIVNPDYGKMQSLIKGK